MDLGNRLCLCNSTGPSALLWKWRRVCCLWTFSCLQDFDIWWKFPSNVENIKWSSSAKFSTIRNMPKKNLQIAFVKCICEFAMVVFLLTIPSPNRWRSEFENVLRFLFWSEVFTSTASSLFVFLRFFTSLLCLQWRFFFFTSSRFAIILIARKTKNLSLKNKGVAHGWTRGFSFPGVSWPWLCAGAHVDRQVFLIFIMINREGIQRSRKTRNRHHEPSPSALK